MSMIKQIEIDGKQVSFKADILILIESFGVVCNCYTP